MEAVIEILSKIFTPINLIFMGVIIYLSWEDYKSFSSDDYKNYKHLIINVGILGTFTGIFWGLLNFEAQNLESIQKSIPPLLDGLRTAFVTSIFGILAALLLTFVQKQYSNKTYSEDGTEILRSIDLKLRNLRGLNETSAEIVTELKSLNSEFNEKNAIMVEILEGNFEKVNENLEKSIRQISEGASKEIVSALTDVIQRFNQEISTGFGDNFRELNEAIGKLLVWQQQHTENLEKMQENLEKTVHSITDTDKTLAQIADKNEQIVEIYQLFSEMTDKYQEQAYQLNTRLLTQIELTEIMKKGIDETLEKFRETSELLGSFSMNIEKELPKSIGNLEKSLVKLSEGFKDDYKTFLDYYKTLVVSQE